jgi:hypothetical protein
MCTSPSCAAIEPTWPRLSGSTPHPHDPAWFCHFCDSLRQFDEVLAIFQFLASHFTTLLLQYSVILKNSVIPHFYSAQSFLLQCSAIFATLLSHVFVLATMSSVILWSCQPFFTLAVKSAIFATMLSHFMMLSVILLQWTQSFYYSELGHFTTVNSDIIEVSSVTQIYIYIIEHCSNDTIKWLAKIKK